MPFLIVMSKIALLMPEINHSRGLDGSEILHVEKVRSSCFSRERRK